MSVTSEVYVFTAGSPGQVGKWGRYRFPFPIDAFTRQGDTLYIRSGDDVLRYEPETNTDFGGDPREEPFQGIVQFHWLDMGAPGVLKQLEGFDVVGAGAPSVAIGYDQADPDAFTPNYLVPADTVPGFMIPMPLLAPSMSVRLTYAGGEPWQLEAFTLYYDALGTTG